MIIVSIILISVQLILDQGAVEDEGAREEAPDSECQATGRSRSCSQGHPEEEG